LKRLAVAFHVGETIGVGTKADKGAAEYDDQSLTVAGKFSHVEIPYSTIQRAELMKLNGIGTVIKLTHDQGTLFLSVIRFMIGQFALINYFATRRLCRNLAQAEHSRG